MRARPGATGFFGLGLFVLTGLLAFAVPVGAAQFRLTWIDNSADEGAFHIERSTGDTGSFAPLVLVPAGTTVYKDWGLIPGTLYCYRVRAVNGTGPSSYSNTACGTATTLGADEPQILTATGPTGGPRVRGFTGVGVPAQLSFFAYNAAFRGGVFVALGNLDGAATVITGAGAGGGPHVQTFRLNSSAFGVSFLAYDPSLIGGVRVASCDVDGDGRAEIITAAGPGGGPHVRIWKLNGAGVDELTGFYAYDPGFGGGVFVGCGDVDGDGRAEIVTGPGAGGGPHVRVWQIGVDRTVSEMAGFFAYPPTFSGGVFVAAGDIDGDGLAEVITGTGLGGTPHVRIWQVGGGGLASDVGGFFAYPPAYSVGVTVGASDLDANGRANIIVGPGPGGPPLVRTFDVAGALLTPGAAFFAYNPSFLGGVTVAGFQP